MELIIPIHLGIYLSTKFQKLCDESLQAQIISFSENQNLDEFNTSNTKKKKIKKLSLKKIFDSEFDSYSKKIDNIILIFKKKYEKLKSEISDSQKKKKKQSEITNDEKIKTIIQYLIKKFVNPPLKELVVLSEKKLIYIEEDVKLYINLLIKFSLDYFENNIDIFSDKICIDLIIGIINEFSYNKIDKTYKETAVNPIKFTHSQIFESLVISNNDKYVKIHLPAAGDIFDMNTNNLFDVKIPLYKCELPSKQFVSKGRYGGRYIWKNRKTITGYFFKYRGDANKIIIKYTNGVKEGKAEICNYVEIEKCRIILLLKNFIDFLSKLKSILEESELKEYNEFIDIVINNRIFRLNTLQLNSEEFVERLFKYFNNMDSCESITMEGPKELNILPMSELEWNDLDPTSKQKYLKYKQKYLQLKKLMQEKIGHLE